MFLFVFGCCYGFEVSFSTFLTCELCALESAQIYLVYTNCLMSTKSMILNYAALSSRGWGGVPTQKSFFQNFFLFIHDLNDG